jgi:hypothetical protein
MHGKPYEKLMTITAGYVVTVSGMPITLPEEDLELILHHLSNYAIVPSQSELDNMLDDSCMLDNELEWLKSINKLEAAKALRIHVKRVFSEAN